MSVLQVVCRLGPAGDPDLEARWEAAEAEGLAAEEKRLAAELDARDDARHVAALLSDEHATSSVGLPVVVVEDVARGPADLPPGSEIFVEGHGRLRRWIAGVAHPARVQDYQRAQAAVIRAALEDAVLPGDRVHAERERAHAQFLEYPRMTDEEYDLVRRARAAGYSVTEGLPPYGPGRSDEA